MILRRKGANRPDFGKFRKKTAWNRENLGRGEGGDGGGGGGGGGLEGAGCVPLYFQLSRNLITIVFVVFTNESRKSLFNLRKDDHAFTIIM